MSENHVDLSNKKTIAQIQKDNPFIKINDVVYDIIESEILSTKIPPDSKLNAKRISEELNVSITPVRNAIKQLIENGLVNENEKSGNYYTFNISDESLIELFTMRKALEGSSAYICAQRMPLIDLNTLNALAEDFRQLWRDYANGERSFANRKSRLDVDRKFHSLLVEYTENRYLMEFYNKLDRLMTHSVLRTFEFWESDKNIQNILILSQHHKTICRAIESGIPEMARRAAEDHMEFCLVRCMINRKAKHHL